jgi:hypothetical protein
MVPIGTADAAGKVEVTASAATIRSVTSSGTVNLLSLPQGCPAPVFHNFGKKETVVGAGYSTTNSTQISFTYQRDQSSTLEVGISASPASGFTFDGDVGISRSGTFRETFPTVYHKARVHFLSEFDYGRNYYKCASKKGYDDFFLDNAYAWAGGAVNGRAGAAPKGTHGRCVPQGKGSQGGASSTTAFQFSAGFSLPGFSGSALTGYDVNTSIEFTYTYGSGYLCGLDSQPGNGDPKLLFAQPNG